MFRNLYRAIGLVEIFLRRVVMVRTWSTAIVIGCTAIAGAFIGATSASAATSVTVIAAVTGGVTGWTISPGSTTDSALTVSYTNNAGNAAFDTVYFNSPYLSNGGTSCSTSNTVCQLTTGGAALTLDVDPATPANTTVFLQFNSNSTNGRIVLNSSGGSGGSGASSGSAPAPIFQEFGKPGSGTCDAAQPEGLNWANVSSGGWGQSWSHWMNGGLGGAVCTRTLVYSSSLSKWIVG
jgi:hypothetical protein